MLVTAYRMFTLGKGSTHLGGGIGGIQFNVPFFKDLPAKGGEGEVRISQCFSNADSFVDPGIVVVYIVIFGDAVQAQAIIRDANPHRPDEPTDYNPDRAHLAVGIRDGIMSVFGPEISMNGPIWSAMTVVTYERWKKGRESMDSIFGGVSAFRWGTFSGYWLMPIVSMTRPIIIPNTTRAVGPIHP